jgi:hypothetical protein
MKLASKLSLVRSKIISELIQHLINAGPSRSAIDIVKLQFGGTLSYTETGHLYIDLGEDGIKYFGLPSPEVDKAWDDLIGGM